MCQVASVTAAARNGRVRFSTMVLIAAIAGFSVLAAAVDGDDVPLYRGVYLNRAYGFSVAIPGGLVGKGVRPPNPNHGFIIRLGSAKTKDGVMQLNDRYIWVDGSYPPVDQVQSISDLKGYALSVIRETVGSTFEEKSMRDVELAGLSGTSVVSTFTTGGTHMIDEEIVALGAKAMYTIGLRTTPSDERMDREIFRRVVAGFRVLKN